MHKYVLIWTTAALVGCSGLSLNLSPGDKSSVGVLSWLSSIFPLTLTSSIFLKKIFSKAWCCCCHVSRWGWCFQIRCFPHFTCTSKMQHYLTTTASSTCLLFPFYGLKLCLLWFSFTNSSTWAVDPSGLSCASWLLSTLHKSSIFGWSVT